MVLNKKGKLSSLMMVLCIFLAFFGVVMIGIFFYGGTLIDQSFRSIDFEINGQNFTEVYDDTLGQGINAFLNSADNYGVMLLFGMVFLMVIASFMFKEKNKVWIILEILILVVTFMIATVLQISYSNFINSDSTLLSIYSTDLIKSSKFILNLPVITTITWALMMLATYTRFKKQGEDQSDFSDIGA